MFYDTIVISFLFFSVYTILLQPTLMIVFNVYYWNIAPALKLCDYKLEVWKIFVVVKSQTFDRVDDSSLRIPAELGIFWAVSNLGLTVNIVESKI